MNLIKIVRTSKLAFYISNSFQLGLPKYFFRRKKNYWIAEASKYPKKMISDRVQYYLDNEHGELSENATTLKDFKRPKKDTMYFYDLAKYTKYFPSFLKVYFNFGDIEENQETLTIVKSRPIAHTGNSVLMKLNQLRHFKYVSNDIPFSEKKDMIAWRGMIHKENRRSLVAKFYQHPTCDIGHIDERPVGKAAWKKPFLPIEEQLKYKFLLSIEGNDVATNLKWIMSSNSLCFMPTPKFETWFMEGKLIPNVHYVHIKDDYSDMLEKIDYYSKHEAEALQIIRNAHAWIAQFKDEKLEKIISLMVLDRYFAVTKQY